MGKMLRVLIANEDDSVRKEFFVVVPKGYTEDEAGDIIRESIADSFAVKDAVDA
jgi:hypothetical protein